MHTCQHTPDGRLVARLNELASKVDWGKVRRPLRYVNLPAWIQGKDEHRVGGAWQEDLGWLNPCHWSQVNHADRVAVPGNVGPRSLDTPARQRGMVPTATPGSDGVHVQRPCLPVRSLNVWGRCHHLILSR